MNRFPNNALAADTAFVAAYANAQARARYSFFAQYVIADEEAGYIALDEGDYNTLPPHIIDQVVASIPAGLDDG